jgi:hypothetical protein
MKWRSQVIGSGRHREHPKGTSSRAFALPYFPGEALRVMFDDVISVEKAPLGRILRNFRCVNISDGAKSGATENDFTGSHVTGIGPDWKWCHRKSRQSRK